MDEAEKEKLRGTLMFAASKYYRTWKPWLLRILKLSRSKRLLRSPISFLALQLAMHESLAQMEDVVQAQIKEHKIEKTAPDVIYNLRLRQVVKDIADGIAWRTLGFNRPLMRVFSQNRAPGFLNNSMGREDTVAKKLGVQGAHVLIHDITNVLRIGDLTIIDAAGPQVIELKKEGRKVLTADEYRRILGRGGSLSDQASRVVELDEAIRTGQLTIGETPVTFAVVGLPVATYHSEVGDIIREASHTGVSGRFLDRILYARAFRVDCDRSVELPFSPGDHWVQSSSLDTLLPTHGHFVRNKMPYSVFPFPDDIVLQLITGEIIVECYLNLIALKKRFQRAGWKVRDHSKVIEASWPQLKEKTEQLFSGPKLFNTDLTTPLFTLSRGPYNSQMPPEQLGLVELDFLKPEIITDTAEYIMQITSPGRRDGAFGIAYSEESRIWQ